LKTVRNETHLPSGDRRAQLGFTSPSADATIRDFPDATSNAAIVATFSRRKCSIMAEGVAAAPAGASASEEV
jgi:hypothetical protein